MKIAELLNPGDHRQWQLLRQIGVNPAVIHLPTSPTGTPQVTLDAVAPVVRDAEALGFRVEAIEPLPIIDKIKQGLADRDDDIERVRELIKTMATLEIPILCYSFMTVFLWGRTRLDKKGRGGALVTAFDRDELADLNSHPTPISESELWANYEYFIRNVLPVAEANNVTLALHPDDPPLSPYRGVARIMRSPEAIRHAMDLSESPAHGLTFCIGSFSTMGIDVPATIPMFKDKIRFVHFRNVIGGPERFVETFHDEGQTDMYAALQACRDAGFDGLIRSDHVPTLLGEPNDNPGYETLGRLYSVGYLRGLLQACGTPDGKVQTPCE